MKPSVARALGYGLISCVVACAPATPEPSASPPSVPPLSAPEPAEDESPQPGWQAEYTERVERIFAASNASNRSYELLKELCVDIGHRLSGSANLERAIAWAEQSLKQAGHDNVQVQPVEVPKWVRNEESLELLPGNDKLPMLGLGGSVATPKQGITAELVVVTDWDDLKSKAADVKNRIVLFDVRMAYNEELDLPGYGAVIGYRLGGASAAAALGAKAMLIRSLTTDPKSPPHGGAMHYKDGPPKIPAAAVSWTVADRLVELAAKGPVRVRLKMGAEDAGMAPSGNVLAELPGTELPNEIVVFGGHIDTWDVGQGAHDNGSGVVASMQALNLLRELNLRPRRTLRLVLWTNEENGTRGAAAYAREFGKDKHVVALESDSGGEPIVALSLQVAGMNPMQPDFEATPPGIDKLRELAQLLEPYGVRRVVPFLAGADVQPLVAAGVPGVGLFHDVKHYFDLHHSESDVIERVKPEALQQSAAVIASTVYVLADMPDTLSPSK